MKSWRADIQGSFVPSDVTAEQLFAPIDSAGFYWTKNRMGKYADERHNIERVQLETNHGQKVYYRSKAFWRASAAANLPNAISNQNYSGLNGFDSRCCAYGVVLAVVADFRPPNAQDVPNTPYPEGYVKRFP
jgi:hypothetical protein